MTDEDLKWREEDMIQAQCEHEEIVDVFDDDDEVDRFSMHICVYCGMVFDRTDPRVVNRL